MDHTIKIRESNIAKIHGKTNTNCQRDEFHGIARLHSSHFDTGVPPSEDEGLNAPKSKYDSVKRQAATPTITDHVAITYNRVHREKKQPDFGRSARGKRKRVMKKGNCFGCSEAGHRKYKFSEAKNDSSSGSECEREVTLERMFKRFQSSKPNILMAATQSSESASDMDPRLRQ